MILFTWYQYANKEVLQKKKTYMGFMVYLKESVRFSEAFFRIFVFCWYWCALGVSMYETFSHLNFEKKNMKTLAEKQNVIISSVNENYLLCNDFPPTVYCRTLILEIWNYASSGTLEIIQIRNFKKWRTNTVVTN